MEYYPYLPYLVPVPVHRMPVESELQLKVEPKSKLQVQVQHTPPYISQQSEPLNLTWRPKYVRTSHCNREIQLSPHDEMAYDVRSPDSTGGQSLSSASDSQLSPTCSSTICSHHSSQVRDEQYLLKRQKNNLSARKSREKAKRKIEEISKKNIIYEKEIMVLHTELNEMKDKCEEISKELDRKNRLLQQLTAEWAILKETGKCEIPAIRRLM